MNLIIQYKKYLLIMECRHSRLSLYAKISSKLVGHGLLLEMPGVLIPTMVRYLQWHRIRWTSITKVRTLPCQWRCLLLLITEKVQTLYHCLRAWNKFRQIFIICDQPSDQTFWLLIMKSQVQFLILLWRFFFKIMIMIWLF